MKKVLKSIFAETGVVLVSILAALFFAACENPADPSSPSGAVQYNITIAGSINGSVSADAETAAESAVVNLTVTPEEGYQIGVVTVTGPGDTTVTVAGTGNSRTFIMPAGNVTVSSTFVSTSAPQYNITIAEGITNESVTSSVETAAEGVQVTLTIAPMDGYQLDTLTVTGPGGNVAVTGTGDSRTFTMPAGAVTVSATFSAIPPVQYNITIAGSITNGSVSADKSMAPAGETVTLAITLTDGYELATLTVTGPGDTAVTVTGSGDSRTFTMPEGAVTVSATFVSTSAPQYSITIAEGITNESVTSSVETAAEGVQVTLTIAPMDGYQLDTLTVTGPGGNVAVTGTGDSRTFTMPAGAVTVSATFSAIPPVQYNITIAGSITNGSVSADKSMAPAGETVTLTITPRDGYELATLTVTGPGGNVAVTGSGDSRTFTMPAGNVTVSATFVSTSAPQYNITIDSGITNGSVSADKSTAPAGETVTLTIAPAEDYQLDTLTVTGPGGNVTATGSGNSRTFIMPAGAVTVNATFSTIPPVQYTITVTQPEESLEGSFTVAVGTDAAVSSSTTAPAGTTITLAATAGTGYEFTQWTVTGVTLTDTTANPATFTMPAGNVAVTAEFTAQVVSYTVTFNANGGSGGPAPVPVEEGGTVSEPDTTGMTNTDENLTFGGWFTDTTLRYPVTFPLTVNEDIEVYAKWDNPYRLVAGEKKSSWQLAGQVVQLTAGNYKLGAEYKVGKVKSTGIYAKLIISVQWVSDGALQSSPFVHQFEGNNTTWTRNEIAFTAPQDGWYRIGIEDSSRNYTADNTNHVGFRKTYTNRIWLYPEDATSDTENKLLDADFAANFLPTAANAASGADRFLDVSTGGPRYTNANIPDWITGDWVPQCVGWWAKTGGDLWLEKNPSIENY